MGELDKQGVVTTQELIASSLAQTDALTKLLMEKGLWRKPLRRNPTSEMDGREATPLIRILTATVLFSESDLSSCIEAGCNDCIVKPYTLEELEEKIQALISASSLNIQ